MSDSSSPPPAQELLLPTDRSSSSDDDVDDDLVIEIHHQTYGGEERQRRRGRGPIIISMPPAPALFAPWVVLGGSGGGEAPAPAASIEALPTVEVSEPGAVCAICKKDLPFAAAARRLPCGHLYHSSCIVPWLEVHNSCPICRCRLPSDHTEPAAGEVAPASTQDPPPAAGTDLQLPAQAVSREGEGTIIVPSV
ncbi:unnamed protein product [Miscanthus lutarioriparius]|uniref:RING-type domain-containing protein n=1 Tax=Miscanthus lutarioriparius TaxID=422564 RepID=A0A811REY1_9POAL|nr:unnamed protein product [Miscanthus lutarioriparius]